jgi:hypothetical protein
MAYNTGLTEQEARSRAEAMAQRLNAALGGEWVVKVWHNSWWCYSVQLGSISVSEYQDGYSALVSDVPNVAGPGAGHWSMGQEFREGSWKGSPNLPSPEEAVRQAMDAALKKLAQYDEALTGSIGLMSRF